MPTLVHALLILAVAGTSGAFGFFGALVYMNYFPRVR